MKPVIRFLSRAKLQLLKDTRLPLILGLLAMLLVLWMHLDAPPAIRGFIARLDNVVYDQRFGLFTPSRGEGEHKIVIVDYDQKASTQKGSGPGHASK